MALAPYPITLTRRAISPPEGIPAISLPRRAILAGLTVAALALSAYLGWVSLEGGSVAGCGGEIVDCDHVLSTRWATWLGMPVGLLAAATYASVLASVWFLGPGVPSAVRRVAWLVVLALVTAAGGSAVWFIGLQVFAVGKFCVPCLATHGCGLALATATWWSAWRPSAPGGERPASASPRTRFASLGVALAALGALVLGQLLYTPQRYSITEADEAPESPESSHAIESSPSLPGTNASASVPTTVVANKPKLTRPIKLTGVARMFDAYEHPLIGSPDARHVVVKLFDYTCHHCRLMHFQLEEAREHFGDRLAIMVLPVPMNLGCNPRGTNNPVHARACVYARLALAVWRADRTKFAEFHHWMFAPEKPPPLAEAQEYAQSLLGDPNFRAAMDDWRLSEQLGYYVEAYDNLDGGKIPKLLDARMKIEGEFQDGKELIGVLEKKWGK